MGNQNISGKQGVTAASAFAGMAVAGASVNMASGQGTDRVRIGLIGCGGRGTGAVGDAMSADPTVTIYGVADLFESSAKDAAGKFAKRFKDRCQIKPDNVFWGFDAYRKLAAMDLDYVVMATPPVFRPYHLRACIEAGKSVFMEKPVAVDPAGARSVIESARIAEERACASPAAPSAATHRTTKPPWSRSTRAPSATSSAGSATGTAGGSGTAAWAPA